MLNRNAVGGMVFEPDFLQLVPGDQVRFLAAMSPTTQRPCQSCFSAGATPFKGRINHKIEVTFDRSGL